MMPLFPCFTGNISLAASSHRLKSRIIHSNSKGMIWVCPYCSLIQGLNIEMQNHTLAFLFWGTLYRIPQTPNY
jgi:hypothetical protein